MLLYCMKKLSIQYDSSNMKGYSGVMNFYNTVRILEVGPHLFNSYKNTKVKAVSQPALHITYKAAPTDTGRTLLLRWENYSHL